MRHQKEIDLLRYQIRRAEAIRRARANLADFTRYTKDDYETNWHHQLLCDYLTDFAYKRIKRLMVFMPPRHGKSEQVSRRFPSFLLGINPDAQIISATYTQPLADSMNRDVQRIIDTPLYHDLFPETQLWGANIRTVSQGSWLRNSDAFEVVGKRGIYRSAGVGGALTGFGMNVGIIDDPIKNREEADSRIVRERLWEWYGSVFYTRLEKDAQILLTMTRWHEDDLAGRLLLQMKADGNAEGWVILTLPAIAEPKNRHEKDPRKEGQALWPNKYSEDALANYRRNLGARDFAALYQQRPQGLEGGIIKRKWFKSYISLPAHFDRIITSWDTAFKDTQGGSYVVGQAWGARGADRYLLRQFRDRINFPETLRMIREMSAAFPKAHAHLVEDKANGSAVIATLQTEISGIVAVSPGSSKESRLAAVSSQFEAGNVYVPDPAVNPWVEDYIDELCTVPNAAYDDQADATSQALDYLRSNGSAGGLYVVGR